MYDYYRYDTSFSVVHNDNCVKFWVEKSGEATSFEFDLSLSEDMKKFSDLIRSLKDIETYVTLNSTKKAKKD